MDDFARLMLQEGVRPLGKGQNAASPRPVETSPASCKPQEIQTKADNSGPRWVSGPDARRTLENAIAMIQEDRRQGKQVWITGIRQDGKTSSIRIQAQFGEIVSQADRENLRLIVLGGDEWTCMMHPEMGIATIEADAI